MRNGRIVIDGVGHVYDLADDNRLPVVPKPAFDWFIQWLFGWGHQALEPKVDGYGLSYEEFAGGWTTEELTRLFFVESDVDIVAMHEVNFFNIFVRGANPWDQCKAIKDAAPDRTILYAAVEPLDDRGKQFERMAQRVESGATGFKFYPVSGFADYHHRPLSYRFDDESIFPYFEHARSLGVRHLAIHKAVPAAHGSNEHDRPDDVTGASAAFPDMTFEVVHSGWAFLEDCAIQLALNLNIYANLECTANTAVRQPRRFAKAVGALVREAPDRVLFGTGAPLGHPQPIIEAIDAFQMPEDLLEEGLPEFTDEIKAGLLGENFARMHGLDVGAIKQSMARDDFATRRAEYLKSPDPWQPKKDRIAGGVVVPA